MEFKTIMALVKKKGSLKHTLVRLGISRGHLPSAPILACANLRVVATNSRSMGVAWPVALKLIGTIRENDFPVHIPSEQLLFKYFPYSSFTGKQYLIEVS